MKTTIVFLLLCNAAIANNYYLTKQTGLPKLKTLPLQTGDSVFFNRGDLFPGNFTAISGVYYGAYGSGALPVISGFINVTGWQNLGGNIWEAPAGNLSQINFVSINGSSAAMGRFPNSGYLTIVTNGANISNSQLTTNWANAEAIVRKTHWVIDRCKINSQSGTAININNPSGYVPINGYGFFIRNDARTLDSQNEWYYNPASKKIRVYSTAQPAGVRVPVIDTLCYALYAQGTTIENISFEGGNTCAFNINSSSNFSILNCSIDYTYNAIDGINNWGLPSANFRLIGCSINHSCNNAVNITASEWKAATIRNNIIKNTATIAGQSGSGDGMAFNIRIEASGCFIDGNTIDSVGYNGLYFADNTLVQNNFITNFCLVKDDGAGIYTGNAGVSKTIKNNIVLNGIGAGIGTADGLNEATGIYIDDYGQNIDIGFNTAANCARAGLLLHNTNNISVHDNTFYNNTEEQAYLTSHAAGSMYNNTLNNNIFFSRIKNANNSMQFVATFDNGGSGFSAWGSFNNNYYCRPINQNFIIHTQENGYGTDGEYSLSQWQTKYGQDANSKGSPKAITTVNDLSFVYNATSTAKGFALGSTYTDVRGNVYPGSITLQPFASAVLILTGAAPPIPIPPTPPVKTIIKVVIYYSDGSTVTQQ